MEVGFTGVDLVGVNHRTLLNPNSTQCSYISVGHPQLHVKKYTALKSFVPIHHASCHI